MYHRCAVDKDGNCDPTELMLNPALCAKKLTELWVLTVALRAVTQRVLYTGKHGMTMQHQSAHDALQGIDPCETSHILLGAGVDGSPRSKMQGLNDALAINALIGPPDYFLTMTGNPHWREIEEGLMSDFHETKPAHRPDLIHRVFNLKKKAMVQDIENGALGTFEAGVHVIEYQKRGLPHCHMLVWVANDCKPRTAGNLDLIVNAQLPDPDTQPEIYNMVSDMCMHNRCDKLHSAKCLVTGKDGKRKCKGSFPKNFREVSGADATGMFAAPKRPDNKRLSKATDAEWAKARQHGGPEAVPYSARDNRFVVPHNIDLCWRYDAHVNVEPVHSARAIQYLFKYFFKDEAKANVSATLATEQMMGSKAKQDKDEQRNEPLDFLNARYMGAIEAVGVIIHTRMITILPTVIPLHVHLEDEQRVYFPAKGGVLARKAAAAGATSTLIDWMLCNWRLSVEQCSELMGFNTLIYSTVCAFFPHKFHTHTHTHTQVPQFFAYQRDKRNWVLRKGFVWDEDLQQFMPTERSRVGKRRLMGIGRLVWTPVRNTELQCLRIILTRKAGATSFEDLRTENGVVYNSFRETCDAMGLLEDGALVRQTMQEVSKSTVSSKAIRFTFAVLLSEFVVSERLGTELWEAHKDRMCAQPWKDREEQEKELVLSAAEVNAALCDIHTLVREMMGKSELKLQQLGLPELSEESALSARKNWRLEDELYNHEEQAERYRMFAEKCNTGQMQALNQIKEAIIARSGGLFVLQGAAGTGKTFLYETLLALVRSRPPELGGLGVALAVASSGIAATLLTGGRTAHNRFKIPIDMASKSPTDTCFTGSQDIEDLLRAATLIIWDEVVMAPKGNVEIVSRTMQAVKKNNKPFGGVVTVLGGDFKQILPVIKNQKKAAVVDSTLHKSVLLWPEAVKLSLTVVVRAEQQMFAKFLATVGDASINDKDDCAALPSSMINKTTMLKTNRRKQSAPNTPADLVRHCFPLLSATTVADAAQRVGNALILAPTNLAKDAINQRCLDQLPGNIIEVKGENKLDDVTNNANVIDTAVLDSFTAAGLPPTVLKLKIGCVVMLLKNIRPHSGLCNGTRIIVTDVSPLQLTGTILGGRAGAAAESVTIPRCRCAADPLDAGVAFHRTQLPFVLAFAATVNKAQGQTLDKVGLDVSDRQCFAHGQLYVALSRVKKMEDIAIACQLNKEGRPLPIANPVYRDVLQEVSGQVEGIFSNLTEEEKEEIRREYTLDDTKYSSDVHHDLPAPSAKQQEANAPLPMTCSHILADQPWDDVGDDEEEEEDWIPKKKAPKKKNEPVKRKETTAPSTPPTNLSPAKKRRMNPKTAPPAPPSPPKGRTSPPPTSTRPAKKARTQTKKKEEKKEEKTEEKKEEKTEEKEEEENVVVLPTRAEERILNHGQRPQQGPNWLAIDRWLAHKFPANKYRRQGIVGDGSCFFYSVSLGLPQCTLSSSAMRQVVTNYYVQTLALDASTLPQHVEKDYKERAKRTGKWYADDVDARVLALQLQVFIVQVNANLQDIEQDYSSLSPSPVEGAVSWPIVVVATNHDAGTGQVSASDHYELVLCNDSAKKALLQHVSLRAGWDMELQQPVVYPRRSSD